MLAIGKVSGSRGSGSGGRKRQKMTTNEELIKLMDKHNLSKRQVSDLIDVSYESVSNWLRQSRSAPMPKVALLALRLSIELKRI
jgi:DNA-binding transcriptional regulator YiaG